MCRLRTWPVGDEAAEEAAWVRTRLGAAWAPGKGMDLEKSGVSQVEVGLLAVSFSHKIKIGLV